MKRPLAMIGGAMLFSLTILLSAGTKYCVALTVLFAFVCAAAAFLKKTGAAELMLAVTCSCAFASLLLLHTEALKTAPQRELCGGSYTVRGRADSFYDAYSEQKPVITLKECTLNGHKVKTDIRVYFPADFSCACGDTIETHIYIYPLQDTGSKSRTEALTARADSGTTQVVPGRRTPLYYVKFARKRLGELLDGGMNESDAAIAKALLLGDRSDLDDDFRASLQISGASHIFAVSGMHLSIWAAALFLIMQKRSRTKIVPNVIAGLFILFYMALTGFSPSVIRAGIMLLTVFAAYCFRRPPDGINSLGLAAIILLTADPLTAADPSFLLSFNSTAAVLLLYPYFEHTPAPSRRLRRADPKKIPANVYNAAALSLCVLLFTVPVCGEYFGTVSLLSPISSILCTLPAEAVMIGGASALALSPITETTVPFRLCSVPAEAVRLLIGRLSDFDFAVYTIDMTLTAIWYLISGCAAAAVYRFSGRNITKTLTTLLVSAALIIPVGIISDVKADTEYSLYLSADGGDATMLLYNGSGSRSALICAAEDDDCLYGIESLTSRRAIRRIGTVIAPYVSKGLAGTMTGIDAENTAGISDELTAEHFFVCDIADGIRYVNHYDGGIGAGVLYCGERKTVMCFFGGADMSDASEELKSGDLLLCRSAIPDGLDLSAFDRVIVISPRSAETLGLPENAVTTAQTGNINIQYKAKGIRYAYH